VKSLFPNPASTYHLKLCSGPCADLITKDEYAELTRQAIDFFSGKEVEVKKRNRGADAQGERGPKVRSRRETARRFVRGQAHSGQADALGRARRLLRRARLRVQRKPCAGHRDARSRGKACWEKSNIRWKTNSAKKRRRILGQLHPAVLFESAAHTAADPDAGSDSVDAKLAADWLSETRWKKGNELHCAVCADASANSSKWRWRMPSERLRIRDLLGKRRRIRDHTCDETAAGSCCGFRSFRRSIEGYDISHTRGQPKRWEAWSCFTDGKPDNAAYSSFTIKGKAGGDDLKPQCARVLRRRLI
jgi:excinuclease UvrABC nuclease subunit